MNRAFAQTLNYSSLNEDWRTEVEGLRLRPGDRVLCPTGSGARPLVLLAAEDVRVTAIDAAPAQNHLLRLLVAAIRELPAEEALGFIGLFDRPGADRLGRLERLDLPGPTRAYWRRHRRSIARGVLYEGRLERHFRRLSGVIRLLRGSLADELMAFDDIEQQRVYARTHWDRRWWQRVCELLMHPTTSRLFFGDPAFYAYAAMPPGPELYRRITSAFERFLARDSFMISLLLTGRLPPGALPPHLRPDGIARIIPRLGNLEILDAEIVEHMKCPGAPRYDRFSLSDVSSFMTGDEFSGLLHAVIGAAAPRARFVLRQFLTRYDVPPEIAPRLVRDPALEARLAREDRAFSYEFIVADIRDDRP